MKTKKTLFFSNIIGNIYEDDLSSRFNNHMAEYLKNNINNEYSMVFIDAPGLGGEDNYLPNILRCFEKININLKNVLFVGEDTEKEKLDRFLKDNKQVFFFLTGGNPYTQFNIIKKMNLQDTLKNSEDLVIGFCAGEINLSINSIITTDDDFDTTDSYQGIGRENITVEPHYNDPNDEERNNELKDFSKKLHTKIYAVPDESIIYFEDGIKHEEGIIYYIDNQEK